VSLVDLDELVEETVGAVAAAAVVVVVVAEEQMAVGLAAASFAGSRSCKPAFAFGHELAVE
jgi:hypothetical protein